MPCPICRLDANGGKYVVKSPLKIEEMDEFQSSVTTEVGGDQVDYVMALDEDRRLTGDSVVQRWGNLAKHGSYQFIPYGGAIEEGTFGGYTIPTRLRAGWWYGTDRYFEVLKLPVDSVEYAYGASRSTTQFGAAPGIRRAGVCPCPTDRTTCVS